ncbi:TonB-dependent receptor [Rhizorhabdus dicambivorans]|nr:TonB-dependent receptor [Rhizorhabdus dicambivorans]
MNHRHSRIVFVSLLATAAAVPSAAVCAQTAQTASSPPPSAQTDTAPDQGLQEIVVTAEKRSTNLQRTPIAVTALTSDTLAKAQVRTLIDIQTLVPNFQMGQNSGYAQITLRGIGISNFVPTAEGAVAVNVNEAYVSRPIAQLSGIYDIGSIEVLRGPQGTLYGRNATAGSVNITTARPTNDWSGYGRATIGNFSAVNVEGAVGGPIVDDKILFRVAGFVDRHSGYGRNLVTGNDVEDKNARGVRGTLVITPVSGLKATVIGEYYKENERSAAQHYFGAAGLSGLSGSTGQPPVFVQQGGYAPTGLQDIANVRDPKFRLRTASATGIVEWTSGPVSLKSVTGYRDQNSLTFESIGAGSNVDAFYIAGEPAHQFSQELQAHYDTSRLHATAGLYYFKEYDASIPGAVAFPGRLLDPILGLPPRSPDYLVDGEIGGSIRTTAKAAFAQASYEIVDRLTFTVGIRVSSERKKALLYNRFDFFTPYISNSPYHNDTPLPAPTPEGPKTFKSTTPKLGIQYQLSRSTLAYASYSKGFKSGGFDVTTIAPAFEPEKLTDYEGGIKTTLLDNRLRLRAAVQKSATVAAE